MHTKKPSNEIEEFVSGDLCLYGVSLTILEKIYFINILVNFLEYVIIIGLWLVEI